TDTTPFEETGHTATYKRIAKVEFTLPDHLLFEACNLICSVTIFKYLKYFANKVSVDFNFILLLQRDLKQRLPLKDVLKHPWIQKYQKNL
ncbi:1282_t:CDS:1, partial [Dentiscutata erythropus]